MHHVNVIAIEHIERADDPRVARFRNVKDAASRSAGLFLAESELVVARVFDAGVSVSALLVTPNRLERLTSRIAEAQGLGTEGSNRRTFPIFVGEQPLVEAIVGFAMHRGCLAICERAPLPTPKILLADARTIVVLDDVVDPDNVGSVFRHVAGFGADGILLSAHAGDPLYRKSVRSSMSWVLEVNYARLPTRDSLLPTLHDGGFVTIALTPRRNAPSLRSVIQALQPTERVALVLGAEVQGLPDKTIAEATYQARIPMTTHVDSLNVATAGALALYDLTTAHPNRIVERTPLTDWLDD